MSNTNFDLSKAFGSNAQQPAKTTVFQQQEFPSLDGSSTQQQQQVQQPAVMNIGGLDQTNQQQYYADQQMQGQWNYMQQPAMGQNYGYQQYYDPNYAQQQYMMNPQQPFIQQPYDPAFYAQQPNTTFQPAQVPTQWAAQTAPVQAPAQKSPLEQKEGTKTTETADQKAKTSMTVASAEFVPKGKMVKTTEQFPSLDDALTKKDDKKIKKTSSTTAQPIKEQEPQAPADPTYGYNSQFFALQTILDPTLPFDPYTNPMIVNDEQMRFVYINYPDYAANPYELFQWLGEYAAFNEMQAKMMKSALDGEDIYRQKPGMGGRRMKNKKKQGSEEDEEDEDTTILSMKDFKKKQPGIQMQELQARKPKITKSKSDQPAKKPKQIVKDVTVFSEDKIVEVDETREPASLVFIGHVDSGKSTISGNLMFLMGVVDQRTIQKYKEEAKEKGRDSWWLAYAMDTNEEEKAKGKTVEVGRACFDLPTKRYTIFDAPGHKNYVPNMISGAALADFGALVISAKRGEFEAGFDMDGQTREHVQLAKSLGIQKLVIVVNKMDEPSVKWNKERFDEIKTNLSPFIESCGYSVQKDCQWVPVSGLNGDNLTPEKKMKNWYNGPSLIEILDNMELPKRDPTGPIRIPILDKMKDRGIVVFGKVESGTINMGEKLVLMPSNLPCQVLNVYNSKNEAVRYAKPGENVQLRLLHISDENMINKGDVLCHRDSPMPITDLFEAEVEVLELLSYKPILSKGYQCILHIHTVADDCVIKDILVAYEKNDKGEIQEKQHPQFTKSFAKMICRIQPRIPVCLEKHETMAVMGRFTLRDEGKTIALGKVIKYRPVKVQQPSATIEGEQKPEGVITSPTVIKEETKSEEIPSEEGFHQINTVVKPQVDLKSKELIFDLETGEMRPKDEVQAIDEEEEYDEEDEGEGENGQEEQYEEEGTQTGKDPKSVAQQEGQQQTAGSSVQALTSTGNSSSTLSQKTKSASTTKTEKQ